MSVFWHLVYMFVVNALGSAAMCIIYHAPIRSMGVSAVAGGMTYVIYCVLAEYFGLTIPGYFLATLFLSVSSEIAARRLKMPATVFVTPAVIPLVPGYPLYQTMLAVAQNDLAAAGAVGWKALWSIGVMAVALAIGPLFFRSRFKKK